MDIPADLKYTKNHEWVGIQDGLAVVGITDFAQDQLGDIVYLDLPEEGTRLKQSEKLGEVESVKAVSELYAPLSGEVVERNEAVIEQPELVNRAPYGEGWMLKLSLENPTELENLLSAQEYAELTAGTEEA